MEITSVRKGQTLILGTLVMLSALVALQHGEGWCSWLVVWNEGLLLFLLVLVKTTLKLVGSLGVLIVRINRCNVVLVV